MAISKKLAAAAAIAGLAATTLLAGTPATAATKGKLLGIVSITATDAGNARVIRGATAAAKAAGWRVEVVDAQGNAATANIAIKNFVAKRAGMIFDLVFPTSSLGAGLAAAKAAKIPVATWGGGLGKGVVMTTGDGAPFATPSVKALLAAMGDKGHILALTYRTGQVCRDREGIFDKFLTGKAGITVTKNEVTIPGFLQDGANYATAWLANNPAGSGPLAIWGCWEDPTLGAISALKQQGRTDVKTYGINGSSTAIKAVQDGSLTATVYEDGVKEGKTMFTTTLAAIKAGAKWKAKVVNVPGVLVTSANVKAFVAAHPEALG
jgi:ribose transport system substrate-binding protein